MRRGERGSTPVSLIRDGGEAPLPGPLVVRNAQVVSIGGALLPLPFCRGVASERARLGSYQRADGPAWAPATLAAVTPALPPARKVSPRPGGASCGVRWLPCWLRLRINREALSVLSKEQPISTGWVSEYFRPVCGRGRECWATAMGADSTFGTGVASLHFLLSFDQRCRVECPSVCLCVRVCES